MIGDSSTLPVPADAPRRVSSIAQLADIPEEEIRRPPDIATQGQQSSMTGAGYHPEKLASFFTTY